MTPAERAIERMQRAQRVAEREEQAQVDVIRSARCGGEVHAYEAATRFLKEELAAEAHEPAASPATIFVEGLNLEIGGADRRYFDAKRCRSLGRLSEAKLTLILDDTGLAQLLAAIGKGTPSDSLGTITFTTFGEDAK